MWLIIVIVDWAYKGTFVSKEQYKIIHSNKIFVEFQKFVLVIT